MRLSDRIGKFALCGALASCTGHVGGSVGGGGESEIGAESGGSSSVGGSPSGTGSSSGVAAGSGTAAASSGGATATGPASLLNLASSPLPTTGLHKLTAWEFANSLQDLLGSGVPLAPVEADTLINGFATVGAASVSISPAGVGTYETVLGNATAYAFADATHAAAVLSCVPQSTTDACLTQALNAFGRRAFRRPLTSDETTLFVNLATSIGNQSGSSVLIGVRDAIWAILQSPQFLYRVELGAPSAADGGRLKYTSFEMASRVAATLWASVPDDTLLNAAAQDSLSTAAGALAQAQRMIADPRVHRSLAAFSDQLFDYFNLGQAQKDPTMYPAWTPTLQAAMLTEVELRMDDLTFTQKADYLSLFSSTTTFVNQELAKFYGVPFTATDGAFHSVDLGSGTPRVGILGAGAILAGHAHAQLTSPTLRGKFIDNMLLCEVIPPPPPGVPPLPAMAPAGSTTRQVLTAHRSQALCASCHSLMDPLGFGMENFDSTGAYRTTDNSQPIDASGTLGGIAFDTLAQLGAAVQKNAHTVPCLVNNVYENALGRAPLAQDTADLNQLIGQFSSAGNHIDQLLIQLVGNDGFRFVAPM
jgi:uncharacterized protein DUF1592/uncharacterized protein DUF1588/uncharacterized protein DUF1595/uncharacterized protein DUF1585